VEAAPAPACTLKEIEQAIAEEHRKMKGERFQITNFAQVQATTANTATVMPRNIQVVP
jgi:hypothetical protein